MCQKRQYRAQVTASTTDATVTLGSVDFRTVLPSEWPSRRWRLASILVLRTGTDAGAFHDVEAWEGPTYQTKLAGNIAFGPSSGDPREINADFSESWDGFVPIKLTPDIGVAAINYRAVVAVEEIDPPPCIVPFEAPIPVEVMSPEQDAVDEVFAIGPKVRRSWLDR